MIKVLLAGHTGLHKTGRNQDGAAYKLKLALEQVREDWKNRVSVIDFEECIRRTGGGEAALFAGVVGAREQRARWRKGWEHALSSIETEAPRCAILSMHLVLAQSGFRASPVELGAVAKWQPDFVVTLIDDIYSVKRRIKLRQFDFSVAQLYDWRSSELMLADQIARLASWHAAEYGSAVQSQATESLLVAVKTPAVTLARIIAQPQTRRAYASFTIGDTRGNVSDKEEINRFRSKLHEIVPTFDPLTIEDKPLLQLATQSGDPLSFHPDKDEMGARKPEGECRWDCRIDPCAQAPSAWEPLVWEPLVWEPDRTTDAQGGDVPFFPVDIRRSEIEELFHHYATGAEKTNLVDDHVTSRDLRLVDQADFLVCYRPFWKGSISTGVGREIVHANESGKPVFAFLGNDEPKEGPLRPRITQRFQDENKFWTFLTDQAGIPVERRQEYY